MLPTIPRARLPDQIGFWELGQCSHHQEGCIRGPKPDSDLGIEMRFSVMTAQHCRVLHEWMSQLNSLAETRNWEGQRAIISLSNYQQVLGADY